MKKKNEEEGKEGDEPKIVEFDEEIGFPIELYVEVSKEKEVTDSGKNEDDNIGGR